MKLFKGHNNAALSCHVSTRYKVFSAPLFQNFLDPSLDIVIVILIITIYISVLGFDPFYYGFYEMDFI